MTAWNHCPECAKKLTADEHGNPTCPEGHFTKWPNPAAATSAFVRNNNEYLIIKRAHEPKVGAWDLPGGFMEYDETGEEGVLREIEEETQLKNLKIARYIGAYPGSYAGVQKVLALTYVIDSADRNVVLSDENSEYKWVTLENMPELAFEDTNAARELLLKGMI